MRSLFFWGNVVLCIALYVFPCWAIAHPGRAKEANESGKILEYAISPDGRFLAEVEAGGKVAGPQSHIVVMRLRGQRDAKRTIYVGRGIHSVEWLTDGQIVFMVSEGKRKGSALVAENIFRDAPSLVFRSRHSLAIAAVDRKRKCVAYTYVSHWKWGGRHSVRVTNDMRTIDLIAPRWARWPITNVGAIRISEGPHLRASRISLRKTVFRYPPRLAWRNGKLLGIVTSLSSVRGRIYDLESGAWVDHSIPLFRLLGLSVSSDGRIAVESTRYWRARPQPVCGCNPPENVYVLDLDDRAVKLNSLGRQYFIQDIGGLWWGHKDDMFAQVLGTRRPGGPLHWWVDKLNWRTDTLVKRYTWANGDLGASAHQCDFDRSRRVALCVAQTLTEPPVLVELHTRTGAIRVLGQMDPKQRKLRIRFEDVKIRNRFGYVSTGFLAVPRHRVREAVPLAVMAYGFSEAYSRYAQWITSYPVAKFVHAGMAVLLVNWANIPGIRSTSFASERLILRSAVSTFANAVPSVRAMGVKVNRAMVMGWSFGGLFAAHAIQSLNCYVAAQVGDPADWNVTRYGIGSVWWRYVAKWGFGGPPVARYINNYVYLDPAGDGKPAHGPILLEFVSRNPDAGQYLQEWRAVGTDVEAFAYHYSVHALTVPAEAKISRLRNLYWAKINLLGPGSVTHKQLEKVGLSIPRQGWWKSKSRG